MGVQDGNRPDHIPPTDWATTVTPVVDVTLHASFFGGGGEED